MKGTRMLPRGSVTYPRGRHNLRSLAARLLGEIGHGPVNARESGYGRLWPIHFGPAHLANPNFGQSIFGQC